MKLGFQGNNGKLVLTADNLKFACQELGIPDDAHTLRRAARAFDLYHSGKVEHITDHSFKVASQNGRQEEPYQVLIKPTKYGAYSCCTCEDWMTYSGNEDLPDVNFWCKHSIAALVWLHNNNVVCSATQGKSGYNHNLPPNKTADNNGRKRIANECGSALASELQDKLNAQIDSQKNNGNGAQAPSQQQLDLSDPFQESEQYDIDQIEGRRDGELVHKLSNGEYVISYKGIMTLAQKHGIEFSDGFNSNTSQVIARARLNGNERVSGKLPIPSQTTAIELAKRNCARQLLPLAEIKAIEHKAKLNAEFNWLYAKAACLKLVPEYNLSILINDLVNAGKLRQDNPSHYDRTEWLMIHEYCKKDAIAQAEMDPEGKSLNRWSYNSVVFLEECQKRLDAMRAEKQVEANEQPRKQGNGKRKLQMDKKLRTWLVEADGTKKAISCREICEQFNDGSIVTRLRAGIDSGADISTVELN